MRVGTKRMNALARSADAHERQHLWEKMAKLYPPYDDYQQAAGVREIPVVILEPLNR
ncbi:nitroreductase/quinone reductase family protein [Litorivivens sp.]|uniref:nitroreductase/quinone reductase family protein n=1 Tax=Litorivivens sp. TaxID=2020868 RepID=UPI003568FE88